MQQFDDRDEAVDFLRTQTAGLAIPVEWGVEPRFFVGPQVATRTRADRYRTRRPTVFEDWEPVPAEPATPVSILALATVQDALEPYPSAMVHFNKAWAFLSSDPENAVKEAVSAVEALSLHLSSGRGSTLGDAIKHLRGKISPMLLSSMEKLWAHACTQPGVRHGGREVSTMKLADARMFVATAAVTMVLLRQAAT
jgi:hypothetical protein